MSGKIICDICGKSMWHDTSNTQNKYKVNENCIGCGACEATCPSVFKLQDDGFAKAIDNIMKKDKVELEIFGLRAAQFIKKEKNSECIMEKVMRFVEDNKNGG